jgi:hypothetical protein
MDDTLKEVYAIANNAIYFDDNSDYASALWEICNKIKPEENENIGQKYIERD